MSVNKVILVGNLGKDPEVKYVNNDVPVASFSLATTESYKDRDGNRQDKTEWHNIVAWRGLATLAEKYLHKGKQIYVEGKITNRSYDDKDGNKRYITEIIADQIQMLGKKDDGASSGGSYEPASSANSNSSMSGARPEPAMPPIDDDLPF